MRVAFVSTDPGVPVLGTKGASVHVQAVVRALLARGAHVDLVAARTGGDPPADLAGAAAAGRLVLHALPRLRGDDPAARERYARRTDAAVADVLGGLEGVSLVYERYALWGRTATRWARDRGTPSVLEVNAPLPEEQAVHRSLHDRGAADDVARSALAAATTVVAVSEPVAAWARSLSGRPVHVVPNGVDVDLVTPGPGSGGDPLVVGFVGTLKPWHGVRHLVDALALLERDEPGAYRLLLVGDGPEAPALREQAHRLGVADLVEHTGSLTHAEVPAQLHRLDVGVAPYPADRKSVV